ncbi:hypothetical protein N7481_006068 [Penicillium waksmanii]|uniref:uncharacterized protein n=1 Tax=Penicillium waksmanii TaxID=69791 RepID=UPI0025490B58|nr:uncharacterized protein N7481_006068 [Penicillium waksmanii]KAJ5983969.1 hypothetical protein N7481_006068 [Penicillium waksmanii]
MFDVTISDIPPEPIIHIGRFLAPSDLSALVQTNKRFYQDLDSILWRQNADLALLWAAENGNMKSARKALRFDANINTEHPPTRKELAQPREILYNELVHDKSHATPPLPGRCSRTSIIAEEEEVVRVLLANQNIDTETRYDHVCPMLDASLVGNVNIIKQLIDHGIRPTRMKREEEFIFLFSFACHRIDWHNGDGRTALFWAATYGQEEALKLLLAYERDERVDVNTQTYNDAFPEEALELEKAGYAGHWEAITPLISAARQGHIGAVRLLLAVDNIDVLHRDEVFGETALMAARSNGRLEIVELLQSYVDE